MASWGWVGDGGSGPLTWPYQEDEGVNTVLDGIMVLWFAEVAASVVFVAIDILRTPESPVLKWGFVVVVLFTGPIGLVLYVLSCREPLPGLHADYVHARWRQVIGSTMHCVAGDGIGILVAAAVLAPRRLPAWVDVLGEYGLGFLFGWTIFQALFMRGMAGGNYALSLRMTFLPEFVSMNALMGGMIALSVPWRQAAGMLATPTHPQFWFIFSMSLTLGFAVTYPLNWWLVSAGLKHGMMTIHPDGKPVPIAAGLALAGVALRTNGNGSANARHNAVSGLSRVSKKSPADQGRTTVKAARIEKTWMIIVSLALLSLGVFIAGTYGSLTGR